MLWNCGGFLNFTEKVFSFFFPVVSALREVMNMLISCGQLFDH